MSQKDWAISTTLSIPIYPCFINKDRHNIVTPIRNQVYILQHSHNIHKEHVHQHFLYVKNLEQTGEEKTKNKSRSLSSHPAAFCSSTSSLWENVSGISRPHTLGENKNPLCHQETNKPEDHYFGSVIFNHTGCQIILQDHISQGLPRKKSR